MPSMQIRVNFYVTMILTALVPYAEPTHELLDDLNLSAVLYGLSLIVTAVIQTAQGQLDLYHAIFVIHMLTFLSHVYGNAMTRFLTVKPEERSFRMATTIAMQTISLAMVYSWAIYVWVLDARFGSQPECNDLVKYIVFGFTVRATVNWYRVLALVIFPLSLANLIRGRYLLLRALHRSEHLEEEKYGMNSLKAWLGSVALAIYSIVILELTVKRNSSLILPGESDWTFGQVVAVVLTLASIIEIVDHLYNARRAGRKMLKQPRSATELQTVADGTA
ncbi:hypothetical protein BC834DRAFT_975731 [Gloeopeniophorella convolvens]|nr:hypothetical protein BC834DRAFT_975905 [Gloeopeniophorella convolvens]KAI0258044.1 hypothetical protein BC834DRAFT_975731 [Gloeopeniophorella convolvens]